MPTKSKWKQQDLFAHNQPPGHAAPKPEVNVAKYAGRALALFKALRDQAYRSALTHLGHEEAWRITRKAHEDFATAVRRIAKASDLRLLQGSVPASLKESAGDEIVRCLKAAGGDDLSVQAAKRAVDTLDKLAWRKLA